MKLYYYINERGKRLGPIPVSELKQHGVTASTYVWCEGMTAWTKVSDIPELKKLFTYVPPTPPPPEYYATPTSISSEQCPCCKSYNTTKLTGKIFFRYVLVIGAAIIGVVLTPVGSVILGSTALKMTESWDNWKCNSCNNSFKR